MEVSVDVGIAASEKETVGSKGRGCHLTVVENGGDCVVDSSGTSN